jgi:F-type H+-transporting ATPase subunit a
LITQLTDNKRFTKSSILTKIAFFALFVSLSWFSQAESATDSAENHATTAVHSEEIISHSDSAGHSGETAHTEEKGFNAGEMIMHHIADAHEIHFATLNEDSDHPTHISLPLPIILWTDQGLKMFSSGNFYHNEKKDPHHGEYYAHENFVMSHEHIYYANEAGGLSFDETGKITNAAPLDLSITKSVLGLLVAGLICVLIFSAVARGYKSGAPSKPRGLQSLLEPMILFVRNEIAIPSIGAHKADRFMPFLLSSFFFIWIANIMGLIPFLGGFNIMGTLGVTLVLATVVFVLTTINGNKHYWSHILWPSGVPTAIKFILVPIEILGIFIKPAVLMIRLTANITAGHIIILSFVSLIIIFGQQSAVAGYGVGVGSLLFMIFMNFIELLVAFLQAYVFTLLSAIYFGSAVEEAHH